MMRFNALRLFCVTLLTFLALSGCGSHKAKVCKAYNDCGACSWCDKGTCTQCEAGDACATLECITTVEPPAAVLINELAVNAAGDDTASLTTIFAELYGPAGQSLEGFVLVGVRRDGTSYGEITLDGQSLDGNGMFVIAHPNGEAALLALAGMTSPNVDYEDGPGSVQLRFLGVVVDAVGYGAFEAGDAFAGEGQPAAAPGEGRSLTRDAAHADTGDNSVDWLVAETPTPRANPSCNVACALGTTECFAGQIRTCRAESTVCNTWGEPVDCAERACVNGSTCGTPEIVSVAAGSIQACALLSSGEAKCWGNFAETTQWVPGIRDATMIAAGGYRSCAVRANGEVVCWKLYGRDNSGVLEVIPGLVDVVSLAIGSYHACALLGSGTVKCWGSDADGQLGDGGLNSYASAPVDVLGLGGAVRAIAAGGSHTCVVLSTGAVACWGSDSRGQLGDGDALLSLGHPVAVLGLESGARDIAAGYEHTCAALQSGELKCWGDNQWHQLGYGTAASFEATPVLAVDRNGYSLTGDFAALKAGYGHTCVLFASGLAACFGDYRFGQTGVSAQYCPSDCDRVHFISVRDDGVSASVGALGAGGNFTCVLTNEDGRVWCFGDNAQGQLGIGSASYETGVPVQVTGLP